MMNQAREWDDEVAAKLQPGQELGTVFETTRFGLANRMDGSHCTTFARPARDAVLHANDWFGAAAE